MPRIKLTKRAIDAIETPGSTEFFWDTDLKGFGLQVTPGGARSFVVKYAVRGDGRRAVIGRYGVITVDQARDRARKILAEASSGVDPIAREKVEATTVDELFDAWMAKHVTPKCAVSTAGLYREVWDRYIRPKIGSMKAAELRRKHARNLHEALADHPTTANHVIRVLRACTRWAEREQMVEWADGSPCTGLSLNEESARERFLSPAEVAAFWTKLPECAMDEGVRGILRLALLLGQRASELCGMMRREIDLERGVWTIPGERTKNGQAHSVPLPPMAREVIARAMAASGTSRFVFPSPIGDQPMDRHSLARALARSQTMFAFVKPGTEDQERPEIATFSTHDLRRTLASHLALLGVGESVIGHLLNHVGAKRGTVTGKHYTAAELTMLKHRALVRWEWAIREYLAGRNPVSQDAEDMRAEERRVLGLETPEKTAEIIPLGKHRGAA